MLRDGKETPIMLWPDDVPRYPRTQNINNALGHLDTISSSPHLGSSSEDHSVTMLKFGRYEKAPQIPEDRILGVSQRSGRPCAT